MKWRLGLLSRVSIIMLVILALFLVYWLQTEWKTALMGPSVRTGIELLIVVILFVSISFWIAFADKEVKSWEKTLLLVGMIFGLLLFLFLGSILALDLSISMPGWKDANPTAVNNQSVTSDLMFVKAIILFGAALGFILTRSRRESIAEWMKNA